MYQTNLYLPYHSDPSDVVGLLCVRKARRGGLSSLVSVASVHNRLLAEHREYLGLYYRLWSFAHLCEPQPSLSPIFSFNQGKLSCRYLRQYIELGHEICGLPLSTVEKEALDLFDAVMLDPAMRMDMMLEPGDLQFANNYAVLHSRNDFEDHDDPAQRRRLLRLWLKMPNAARWRRVSRPQRFSPAASGRRLTARRTTGRIRGARSLNQQLFVAATHRSAAAGNRGPERRIRGKRRACS